MQPPDRGTLAFPIQCYRVNAREFRNLGWTALVGRARFELATNGLKVRCSTG